MQRYFIQFTYRGNRFQGLQKQFLRPLDLHHRPPDEIRDFYVQDEVTNESTASGHVTTILVSDWPGDGAGSAGVGHLAHAEASQSGQARYQLQAGAGVDVMLAYDISQNIPP